MTAARTGFWLPAASLWWRELVRFYRFRSRVVGALATPVVFWFLIGSGIGSSFHPTPGEPSMHYSEYFFPGSILLVVLFTSIFCMVSLIEDRQEGFLLSVLVAPVSRGSVVLGKVLGGATLALLQGMVFVLLAPLAGLRLHPAQVALLAAVLFVTSFGLAGLGFLVAWRMDSVQGFHAVINLFLMPLWLLSGALFSSAGASGWIRVVMAVNPLTYALAALRHALYYGETPAMAGGPSLETSLAVTLAFAIVTTAAAFWLAAQPAGETG